MVLSLIHGTWISEELEPVTLQFEWQRSVTPLACSEDDCICPKELAAHLIWSLVVGCEGEVVANGPFVLSPEGSRVAEQAIQNDGRPLSIC
jgi:hypothetical protein